MTQEAWQCLYHISYHPFLNSSTKKCNAWDEIGETRQSICNKKLKFRMLLKVPKKTYTCVQTFRDCALHQWNVRYELSHTSWHVLRRKMRRITCLFLCLFPSKRLIPRTSASAAVCPLELKCSETGKPGAFLSMLRRCSPKHSLRVRPVSPM